MDKKRFDFLKQELFDWAAQNDDAILSPGDDVLERVKAMSSMKKERKKDSQSEHEASA